MAVSSRTAMKESKYSCASDETWTKKSTTPIPSRMVSSRLTFFSTITLSTTISVKTGKSSSRKVMATASSITWIKSVLNLTRNGRSQAIPGLLSGAFAKAIV